jgi:hypothetical protein
MKARSFFPVPMSLNKVAYAQRKGETPAPSVSAFKATAANTEQVQITLLVRILDELKLIREALQRR